MNLKEYLIEAVARRTTGKYIELNKDNIIDLLRRNGFKSYDYNDMGEHIYSRTNAYMIGPNTGNTLTNWISIHTLTIDELLIRFNGSDEFESAEIRDSGARSVDCITYKDAVEIINNAVK